MLKLTAQLSKKLPVPGIDFSSHQFGCSIEVELAQGSSSEEIRAKIHGCYQLLEASIDAEIQARSKSDIPTIGLGRSGERSTFHPGNSRSSGNGNAKRQASSAQVKAIFAISKAGGISRKDLMQMIERKFLVIKPEMLSLSQASEMIEILQNHNLSA